MDNLKPVWKAFRFESLPAACLVNSNTEAKARTRFIGYLSCYYSLLLVAMKRIEQWLAEMTSWKVGKPRDDARLIAFRAEGEIDGQPFVTLVDMGLPNHVNDRPILPTLGPKVPLFSQQQRDFIPGAFYGCAEFKVTEDGLHLPNPSSRHNTCRIANHFDDSHEGWVELFAGMGSWSFAAEKMGQKISVAVDNCPIACKAYAKNHSSNVRQVTVDDLSWLPKGIPKGFLMSPPCPAFSCLKGIPGLMSRSADSWQEMALALRLCQPVWALLENPRSLWKRIHEVKKLFTVCGYVMHQAYVVQLDNYGPMKRDRTILVFVRLAESYVFRTPACPWLPKGDGSHTLETFQCLVQDDLLDPVLCISDFQKKVLSDPELAKAATSKQAWNARLINPSEKLPTIQHLYVESINMNRKTLLEHGLHCPVLNAPEPRFVSPWEVARGMMHPQSTALPCEACTAWKLLGNSVSPLQCAVGLCAVELVLGRLTRVEADAIISFFPKDAVQINGVTQCTVDAWTTLHLPLETPSLNSPGSPVSEVRSDDSALACGPTSRYTDLGTEEEDEPADEEVVNSPGNDLSDSPRPDTIHDKVTAEEWLLHTTLFDKISGVRPLQSHLLDNKSNPPPPCAQAIQQVAPVLGLTQHLVDRNLILDDTVIDLVSPEPALTLPDTIPWKPILPHTRCIIEDCNLASCREQSPEPECLAPTVEMSAKDFGSGSQRRSRSPLPRAKKPQDTVDITVKSSSSVETFTVNQDCPLLLVKAMLLIPDSTQAIVLSFRHVNLAAHTKASSLFTHHRNPWVMLTYVSKNSAGGGPHFTIKQGLLAPFGRGCECTTQTDSRVLKDSEEFVTWIRAKRAFDLATLLPDGRLAFFTFNGESVTAGFARKELARRFGQQFYSQNPVLCVLAADPGPGLHLPARQRHHPPRTPSQPPGCAGSDA